MFRYLPEQASDFAHIVDGVHHLVTDLSVFFTVAIVGTMIYFAIKYRKQNGVDHETPRIEGSHLLEILWTVVPTIICVFVAAYGWYGFKKLREVPTNEDVLEIEVTGKQWYWTFKYPNGKEVVEDFVVPVDRAVKLILTSSDVLHSFFVPTMRTKMDAVPGRYTYQWFRPIVTGPQQVYCTEYCGTNHSGMLAKMNVVSDAEFKRWVEDKGEVLDPMSAGRKLYNDKGCKSCHSIDGSRLVGPSFLNLFGRKEKFDNGEEYSADENYLRESIYYPQAKIVSGYPKPSPMPAYEGQLNDTEISNLIAYIKSLKGEAKVVKVPEATDLTKLSPAQRGEHYYKTKACIGCHSLDGSQVVGPSFKGLYNRDGEFDDGTKYKADDAYIKESILNSQKHVVKGYPNPSPMPAYEGQFVDQDINDIIEFIKTIK